MAEVIVRPGDVPLTIHAMSASVPMRHARPSLTRLVGGRGSSSAMSRA
ncbi:MAG: hypothetical protein ACRDOI_01155 [Trebonia sp.]